MLSCYNFFQNICTSTSKFRETHVVYVSVQICSCQEFCVIGCIFLSISFIKLHDEMEVSCKSLISIRRNLFWFAWTSHFPNYAFFVTASNHTYVFCIDIFIRPQKLIFFWSILVSRRRQHC